MNSFNFNSYISLLLPFLRGIYASRWIIPYYQQTYILFWFGMTSHFAETLIHNDCIAILCTLFDLEFFMFFLISSTRLVNTCIFTFRVWIASYKHMCFKIVVKMICYWYGDLKKVTFSSSLLIQQLILLQFVKLKGQNLSKRKHESIHLYRSNTCRTFFAAKYKVLYFLLSLILHWHQVIFKENQLLCMLFLVMLPKSGKCRVI